MTVTETAIFLPFGQVTLLAMGSFTSCPSVRYCCAGRCKLRRDRPRPPSRTSSGPRGRRFRGGRPTIWLRGRPRKARHSAGLDAAWGELWLGQLCLGQPWVGRPWLGQGWLGRPWVGRLWFGRGWVGRPWVGRPWVRRPWVGRPWVGRPWVGQPWIGARWIWVVRLVLPRLLRRD